MFEFNFFFFLIYKNAKKKILQKKGLDLLISDKLLKFVYRLTKAHKSYSSGPYDWGSVYPIEENILLLNNIDLSNDTAVM